MQFINPVFLWALAALTIPVIIHLFHFRRFKKVYFTNVHLLKELKEETSTRSKLRNLIILLTRCLALAFLVFAFAQPILSDKSVGSYSDKAVSIFVDNSFSMQSTREEVPLLTLAKDNAADIVTSYSDNDQFLILTHDLEAKHQRYVDKKTALSFVDEIRATPEVEELQIITEVISRLTASKPDLQAECYLLSDFQANISNFENILDTSINITLIPLRAVLENNVSIQEAAWEAPQPLLNEDNRLLITLANHGNETEEVELRLTYDDQERPLGSISIPANSEMTDTAILRINKTGWQELVLSTDDYPVTFDNELFGTFSIDQEINVLSVYESGTNQFLNTAFNSIGYFQLDQVNKNGIRYEALSDYELVILDDLRNINSGLGSELDKYVKGGGNLVIFPSINADPTTFNQLLGRLSISRLGELLKEENSVTWINDDSFIFSNVFESTKSNVRLPSTQSNWQIQSSQTTAKESLLKFKDGSDYLNSYNVEKGYVFLCASSLSQEVQDLVLQAEVFVPMLYKMALAKGTPSELYYTIGDDDLIRVNGLNNSSKGGYLITGKEEFIPGVTVNRTESIIDIRDQVNIAGIYSLTFEEEEKVRFGFNYSRVESDVSYADMSTIASQIGEKVTVADQADQVNLASFVSTRASGTPLWRWCLVLCLLLLLIETLLLRVWK